MPMKSLMTNNLVSVQITQHIWPSCQLVDKITSAVERNETTIGIFLDLSKAFDTIDHKMLLHKLEHYRFGGVVLEWFENYLIIENSMFRIIHVNQNKKILYVVSHKDPLWVLYFLYCMLMI